MRCPVFPVALTAVVALGCGAAVATDWTSRLVSHAVSGDTADGLSRGVALSGGDGRYVALASRATNLVAGVDDRNRDNDVYLVDRQGGQKILVSHAAGQAAKSANAASTPVALSADGNVVLFESSATDLVAGGSDGNLAVDVYVYDRTTAALSLVSHAVGSPVTAANGESRAQSISADGRYVVYQSLASNLVAGTDSNGVKDEFLYDRSTGTSTLVSHALGAPNQAADKEVGYYAQISADGRYVVYTSFASNLFASSSANAGYASILYDRQANSNRLLAGPGCSATVPPASTTNTDSFVAGISADGQRILMNSLLPLVGTGNGNWGVYLIEPATQTCRLLSHTRDDATAVASGTSFGNALTPDGHWALFHSDAANLIPGVTDTNQRYDLFLADTSTGALTLVSHQPGLPTVAGPLASSTGAISDDGSLVVLDGQPGTGAVPYQIRTVWSQTLLFRRSTGEVSLVSHAPGRPLATGDDAAIPVAISGDGSAVLFDSRATDVAAATVDGNASFDTWIYRPADDTESLVTRAAVPTVSPGSAESYGVLIDRDGDAVAFTSAAQNLLADTRDGPMRCRGIYAGNLLNDSVTLVSRRLESPTLPPCGDTFLSKMSDDGDSIGYRTNADTVLPGVTDFNDDYDLFSFRRSTQQSTLLSRSYGSSASTNACCAGLLGFSASGHFALLSGISDMIGANRFVGVQALLFNYGGPIATLESLSYDLSGTSPSSSSYPVAISAEAERVLFNSAATDVVANVVDSNNADDVFVRDRGTATTTLVSRVSGGGNATGNGASDAVALSRNGRYVLLRSRATNLTSVSDGNGGDDLYVADLASPGTFRLVSHAVGTATITANAPSTGIAISADGQKVLFQSAATNLVSAAAQNGQTNVFLHDLASGQNTLVSRGGSGGVAGNGSAAAAGLSADGLRVLYSTASTDVIVGLVDTNTADDCYVFDVADGSTRLISHRYDSLVTTADAGCFSPALAQGGTRVGFVSAASDLVGNLALTTSPLTSQVYVSEYGPTVTLFSSGFE